VLRICCVLCLLGGLMLAVAGCNNNVAQSPPASGKNLAPPKEAGSIGKGGDTAMPITK
jgi:hypothetical protein